MKIILALCLCAIACGCCNSGQIKKPTDWESAKDIMLEVRHSQGRILDYVDKIMNDEFVDEQDFLEIKNRIRQEAKFSEERLLVVAEYLDGDKDRKSMADADVIQKLAEEQRLITKAMDADNFSSARKVSQDCYCTMTIYTAAHIPLTSKE